MKLKRTSWIVFLCLVVCLSLLPVSAFADQTVIIVGGAVQQDSSVVVQGASAQTATVLAGDAGTILTDGATGSSVARNPGSIDSTAVIVMPDGTVVTPQAAQSQQAAAATTATAQTTGHVVSTVPAGLAGQIYQRIND